MQTEIMKIEYDTTDIDIDTLCAKYEVNKEDLDWYKEPTLLPKQPIETTIVPGKFATPSTPEQVALDLLLQATRDVKEKAVAWAKDKLDYDSDELMPKDVKDLVAIVDTVEAGFKPKDKEGAIVVNVLVQNLMDAKDDC